MIADDTQTRTQYPVHYKTVRINNLDIFYREAGRQDAPVILLLARFPNFFQHVPEPDPAPLRLVSCGGSGLSRLRPKQYAGSHHLRVQLREPGEGDERLCRVAWFEGVLDVRDGLRRADRLPARAAASRTDPGADRAEWQCLRRGAPRVLGPDQEVLGRSHVPKTEARCTSWSIRNPLDGSTKTACRTLRCWTRPRGWSIKPVSIAPEIVISRWT